MFNHYFELKCMDGIGGYPLLLTDDNIDVATLQAYDAFTLYGVLVELFMTNSDRLDDIDLSIGDVINSSTFEDNKLYLNDFLGYWIDERYKIRYLFFYMGKICMAIQDTKKDRYLYFQLN